MNEINSSEASNATDQAADRDRQDVAAAAPAPIGKAEAGKSAKRRRQRRELGQRTEIASGKHLIRIFLGRDSNGRRHYHSEVVHGGVKQAEARIRELNQKHKAGEALKANNDTFSAFIDEWFEAKRLTVGESSIESYRRAVELYIRPTLGKLMLAKVQADDVQRLYGALHRDRLGLSSIRYVHTLLNMIFKLAVKRKKIHGSPMAGVEIPKEWQTPADSDEETERAMSPEQVAQFLEAARADRFAPLFTLAFHMGCRPGELLALKWSDLSDGRTIRINRTIVWRKAGDWYLKSPKTKLSRRALPLTDYLIETLSAHRRRQLEERLKAGKCWNDHGFVFANEIGEPYPQWILRNHCKEILKAAGLPDHFSPYTARHTSATVLITSGVDPKTVSERLGHSKVTITLQTYTHVSEARQAEASETIERLLAGRR